MTDGAFGLDDSRRRESRRVSDRCGGGRSRRGGSSESWRNSSRCTAGPPALRMDNGPELTALAFVEWCDERRIARYYIQPGKPDQNAFIERFNRTYRTEVLDAYLFDSLAEVRALTERWLVSYNQERPHDSLGRVPPLTFLPRLTLPEQSPFEVST